MGQGQLRVIIWANLVVLEHPMMHTKFQGHQPFGPGKEDILNCLPYMGMAAILVMCPEDSLSKFSFPHPIEASYDIWLWLAQLFLRRCLKSVDDVRRTTEAYLSYKLTKWSFGSGELNICGEPKLDMICIRHTNFFRKNPRKRTPEMKWNTKQSRPWSDCSIN